MSLPLGLPIGRLASSEPGHRTASESTRQPIGRVNPMVQRIGQTMALPTLDGGFVMTQPMRLPTGMFLCMWDVCIS